MVDLKEFGIDESFLAHTPKETLIEHTYVTKKYLTNILEVNNLDNLIDKLISSLDEDYSVLIKEMFLNAVYLHDIGKKNKYFQAIKMSNDDFKDYKDATKSTNHSFNSSEMYIKYYQNIIKKNKDRKKRIKLSFILYNFSYHISKHHGRLSVFKEYRENEGDLISSFRQRKKFNINDFEFFILNKLLFSLLISSDYYATTEYMAGLPTKDFGTISKEKKELLIKTFEEYKIVQNIRNHTNIQGINTLRSKMFLESEQILKENPNKNIFYLEAPTGSGKTLNSINLAMNFLKEDNINKIFYVFPFNTLVEQTKDVFDKIFNSDKIKGDVLDIEVINSITPIKEKDDITQENEESKYQKSYINRLFFHHELIITTHISFFNILFGTSKEDNFPLWQLANSVIILDEIQSYDNNLWSYMTKFFEIYSEALNIKIIIMSATLPKLDRLIEKDSNRNVFVNLIKNRDEYFYHDYFKNRVKIDYSILNKKFEDKKISLDELKDEFFEKKEKYNKILFEFITKRSARKFYDELINDSDYEEFSIYELSGDDNKAYRQKVIDETKKAIKIIVIATQVIEAGVDIDMDLGFKDISTLDSEEQFMGRINRSCLKSILNPKVYFFDMDKEDKIYKSDNRVEFNLKNKQWQEVLISKNFEKFYKELLAKLKSNDKSILSGTKDNFEKFNLSVQNLDYKNIEDKMKLIKSENFRLYFPFQLDVKLYKIKEFENIDKIFLTNNKLDGQKVWNEFINLNNIKGYAKKELHRYKLNSLMQFFTFNIVKYPWSTRPCMGEELFGFYFIQSLEFITKDNKFDREKYYERMNEIFI